MRDFFEKQSLCQSRPMSGSSLFCFSNLPFHWVEQFCWGRGRWHLLPLTLCRSSRSRTYHEQALSTVAKAEQLWIWVWQMSTGHQHIRAGSKRHFSFFKTLHFPFFSLGPLEAFPDLYTQPCILEGFCYLYSSICVCIELQTDGLTARICILGKTFKALLYIFQCTL